MKITDIFKLIILLFLGLILGSCSKSQDKNPSHNSENSMNWFAGIGQFNGSLDFGNLTAEQNKILTVTIKNVGNSSLEGPVTISGSDFYLAYQNCTILLPDKTCSVKIGFNSQEKLNQGYSANLYLGDQSAVVTASVDLPTPVTELQALIANTPITSLDFGVVKFDQVVMKTLVIKNGGQTKGPWVVGQSGNGFVISYDNCSNKEILPNKSCTLKISLSGAGKSGEITDTLIFGNLELPMIALVKNLPTVAVEESDVKVLVNNQVTNPGAVDLGTWNLRQTKILNLYLKNEGTDKGIIEEPEIPEELQTAYSNCEVGKILSPKSSCMIKLVTIPQSKGVQSTPLVFQGNSYNFQATVREPGDKIYCSMNNASEAFITWNGSSYSSCQIEECSDTYHLWDNSCDPDVISCDKDFGTATRTWLGSEYGECLIQDCNPNYHEFNNQCDPDSISCEIDNAVATKAWHPEDLIYGDCLVQSCNTNYHQVDNTCEPDSQSCFINNGTGSQDWTGTEWGVCNLMGCNPNFHTEDNQTCVSDTRSCPITNGVGTQTWNGTSWNACQLDTCNANFFASGNSCIPGVLLSGSTRLWADGTRATSCNGYKNPGAGYTYQGGIGSGVYSISSPNGVMDVWCDQEHDNGGWTLVRRMNTAATWMPLNDGLSGVAYGTYVANATAGTIFSTKFNNWSYSQLYIRTGDSVRWMQFNKTELSKGGDCASANFTVNKSSDSATAYNVSFCNRAGAPEDPWISKQSHSYGGRSSGFNDDTHSMLYGENSFNGWNWWKVNRNGISIFVR